VLRAAGVKLEPFKELVAEEIESGGKGETWRRDEGAWAAA
jgi:hypothetical protein